MKRMLAAVVVILTFTFVLALPAGATGDEPPQGDTDTTVDMPEDLERRTAKAMRQRVDDPRRWPCFFGIGSCYQVEPDTGYLDCADITVDEIGITWSANQGYDTIHVVPTDQGRIGSLTSPAATIAGATAVYVEMHQCLNRHGLEANVRSWTGIWQQIHCHIVFQLIGGGGSWDLEGHRRGSIGYLNPFRGCSW